VQIEISSRCNLNCKNCYRKLSNRKVGDMQYDIFKEAVDKLIISEKFQNFLYLAGFGESMINPKFFDMLKYAKRKNCRLMLPTNGTILNEETIPKLRLLDNLQISIDSLIINKELRGNDNVLNWLPLLKKYRIPTQLNVTINSKNIREIREFLRYSIMNQVPVYFMFSTPFLNQTPELVKEYKFCIDNYNELNHLVDEYIVNASVDVGCNTFNNCRYLNRDFSVAWNGNLYPCNDALLRDYKFGHISDFNTFDDFYQSVEMNKVNKGQHPICDCCKYWDNYWNSNFKKEFIYDKRLDKYHNLHKGKRCFVIGSGPSFTKEIADNLHNEITIGSNFIAHAKDIYNFSPTYCTIGDADMICNPEFRFFLDRLDCPIFYPELIFHQSTWDFIHQCQFTEEDYKYTKKLIAVRWKNPKLKWSSLMMPNKKEISFDLKDGILESGSVIQGMSIPLASWLGCKDIYLVGCDNDNSGHFYNLKPSTHAPGADITKQYGWLQKRLMEEGKIMYNIQGHTSLPYIDTISMDAVFNSK